MNADSRAKAKYNKKNYKSILLRYKTDDRIMAKLDRLLRFSAIAGKKISRNEWILGAIRDKLRKEKAAVGRNKQNKSVLDKIIDWWG